MLFPFSSRKKDCVSACRRRPKLQQPKASSAAAAAAAAAAAVAAAEPGGVRKLESQRQVSSIESRRCRFYDLYFRIWFYAFDFSSPPVVRKAGSEVGAFGRKSAQMSAPEASQQHKPEAPEKAAGKRRRCSCRRRRKMRREKESGEETEKAEKAETEN